MGPGWAGGGAPRAAWLQKPAGDQSERVFLSVGGEEEQGGLLHLSASPARGCVIT